MYVWRRMGERSEGKLLPRGWGWSSCGESHQRVDGQSVARTPENWGARLELESTIERLTVEGWTPGCFSLEYGGRPVLCKASSCPVLCFCLLSYYNHLFNLLHSRAFAGPGVANKRTGGSERHGLPTPASSGGCWGTQHPLKGESNWSLDLKGKVDCGQSWSSRRCTGHWGKTSRGTEHRTFISSIFSTGS